MEQSKLDLLLTMTDEELAQTNTNVTANLHESGVPEEDHQIDLDTLVAVQIEQICRQVS